MRGHVARHCASPLVSAGGKGEREPLREQARGLAVTCALHRGNKGERATTTLAIAEALPVVTGNNELVFVRTRTVNRADTHEALALLAERAQDAIPRKHDGKWNECSRIATISVTGALNRPVKATRRGGRRFATTLT